MLSRADAILLQVKLSEEVGTSLLVSAKTHFLEFKIGLHPEFNLDHRSTSILVFT